MKECTWRENDLKKWDGGYKHVDGQEVPVSYGVWEEHINLPRLWIDLPVQSEDWNKDNKQYWDRGHLHCNPGQSWAQFSLG